jgi:prephenate dehydrogenase
MKKWDVVAIVGVGLIGGSIGIDLLRGRLAHEVVGIGRRAASLRAARRKGAVTRTTLDLARGVANADLVVVCTPVGRIVDDVLAVAAACPQGALITDVGSTKFEIVTALEKKLPPTVWFVGSHPLAGGEQAGAAAAMQGLFRDRVVVITPSAAESPTNATETVEAETRRTEAVTRAIRGFWKSLGARVVCMSAEEHDRKLAASSHLPHLAASALAAATPADCLPLASSGFADTTRVASGDPSLWRQILLSNRGNVLTALTRFEGVLAALRQALEAKDTAEVERTLTEAKRNRDALGS